MQSQPHRMFGRHTDIAPGETTSHPEVNVSAIVLAAMIALTHELITRRTLMNKLLIITTSLAALGLVLAATNGACAAQKSATSRYECVTDNGYSRKLPCSYRFKLTKRADGAFDCFTDDGYGRKLPCSYGIKRH